MNKIVVKRGKEVLRLGPLENGVIHGVDVVASQIEGDQVFVSNGRRSSAVTLRALETGKSVRAFGLTFRVERETQDQPQMAATSPRIAASPA